MTNQQLPNPKRDTITITPQPPSEPPKGFGSGYWQPSRFPVALFIIGIGFIVLAVAILGGVGYVLLQLDETPEPVADRSDIEHPTATLLIIGGGATEFAPIVTSMTSTASNTPTQLDLVTNTPAEDVLPTATFTFSPPTQLPPTNTSSPTRTPTITATFTATVTASPTSTFTPTASPTLTLSPSNTHTPSVTPLYSATPTRTLTPSLTVPPPTLTPNTSGHLLKLFYDEWSFYAWNGSTQQFAISNLVFEAIDANGNEAGYRLEGSLWAQFYAYLEVSKCVAVEITTSPSWLRPTQCWDYNAVLTPQTHYKSIFWLDRPNVVGFRVLWQGAEIGLCETGVGQCSVYIPR